MAAPIGKVEARAVIRFLYLKGQDANTIHAELVAVYVDNAPAYDTVVKWRRRFQCSQTSLDDRERSGRPSLDGEPQIAAQVEAFILADRWITVEELAGQVNVSAGPVHNIVHYNLHMTKVAARWVPCLLMPVQKDLRKEAAAKMLKLCESDPDDFLNA